MDSNHRRREPADLQSAPVGHLGNLPLQGVQSLKVETLKRKTGAVKAGFQIGNRTPAGGPMKRGQPSISRSVWSARYSRALIGEHNTSPKARAYRALQTLRAIRSRV